MDEELLEIECLLSKPLSAFADEELLELKRSLSQSEEEEPWQADLDSDDPAWLLEEKPSECLLRCLIATNTYKNVLGDALHGSFYTLDMVRLKLKAKVEEPFEKVSKVVECWTLPRYFNRSMSRRIGSYRTLWALDFEESSVVVGLGFIGRGGKTNEGEGFVEFNPNKVGEQGIELVKRLLGIGVQFELVRYDLAIDYPLKRDSVRLVKDTRKYGCECQYECEVLGSMTEYLGQRNKPGRTKVYDKQAQAKLDCPCTRVELTCDATWDVETILGKLPTVFSYANASFEGLKGITKAFAISVQTHLANGESLEPWLAMCEPRTAREIRKVLSKQQALKYDASCIEGIIKEALSVCDGSWVWWDKTPASTSSLVVL